MEDRYEVELAHVSKRFDGVTAVDAVSIVVGCGEFLTLLGPSGCGKTTLLRIIAGFETPDSGAVILSGKDVTQLPPYQRDVTTVFQHYALFPHLDVFGNVAFGLRQRGLARGEIRRRVNAVLELVKLPDLNDRRPAELSGGQQQRVALARALILEPRVLLLDEPLAALDLKLRRQMQVELKGLQRRVGISFVYVTHDQEEALTMSDRVAVMSNGRVEQVGSAEEIYEHPGTEFVADFVGASNILDATLVRGGEGMSVVVIAGTEVAVSRLPEAEALPGERVRIMIRPEKISVQPSRETSGLQGTIESGVYLGDSTQWRVRLENGQEVVVVAQNRDPYQSPLDQLGRSVSIKWEPQSAVVLSVRS